MLREMFEEMDKEAIVKAKEEYKEKKEQAWEEYGVSMIESARRIYKQMAQFTKEYDATVKAAGGTEKDLL